MKWVIQNNIYEEEGYASLIRALEKYGSEVVHVKVVPFEGSLEAVDGELPASGADAIVMGSYTLSRVAKQMGWRPGSFLDNLDFRKQHVMWGGDVMLNADALICEFGRVPFQAQPFFMRPVHDTKAFAGKVFDWGQYIGWSDSVSLLEDREDRLETERRYEEGSLTMKTPVMVCSKKEIWSETRTWVVAGAQGMSLTPVVTASGYKVGTIKRYTPPESVDLRILEFVDRVCSTWRPNAAFVLDVADTPDGLKVIEVNNLNSAGFYKADMFRLVEALERWAADPSGLLMGWG